MHTPLSFYNQQVQLGSIVPDDAQLMLLAELQHTCDLLLAENKQRSRFYNKWRRPKAIKGHYVWGGVGIGKTFVMDCFYHALPITNKLRVHFHEFMRDVHASLKQYQGENDPLQLVAAKLAKKAIVICFDELIVTDITDAMLISRLLRALINRGVCIVMTSNTKPDDLYKNGLQRISFLPAIELIKQVTTVSHVVSPYDYRLRHLQKAGVFHVPNDEIAENDMEKCFLLLTEGHALQIDPILICDRLIIIRKRADKCVWFDFKHICLPPRSQHDYLEIAQHYTTVFISDIPRITSDQNDRILLFIRMIDVFYDARIRVVCSAAVPIAEIYTEGTMIADYQRTQSRLQEMQSEHYFLR